MIVDCLDKSRIELFHKMVKVKLIIRKMTEVFGKPLKL